MLWRNTGGGGGDGTGGVEEGMVVALCAVGFAEREGVTSNMSKLYRVHTYVSRCVTPYGGTYEVIRIRNESASPNIVSRYLNH